MKNIQEAFAELYYHLLIKGIDHENSTGRAPLPRRLQVWKDSEDAGADKLLLANLEDRLRQAAKSTYNEQLYLDQFFAVESKSNPFIQIADLLSSSANRLLNRTGEKYTQKDEFAEYFLDSLEIDLNLPTNDTIADMAVHISL